MKPVPPPLTTPHLFCRAPLAGTLPLLSAHQTQGHHDAGTLPSPYGLLLQHRRHWPLTEVLLRKFPAHRPRALLLTCGFALGRHHPSIERVPLYHVRYTQHPPGGFERARFLLQRPLLSALPPLLAGWCIPPLTVCHPQLPSWRQLLDQTSPRQCPVLMLDGRPQEALQTWVLLSPLLTPWLAPPAPVAGPDPRLAPGRD